MGGVVLACRSESNNNQTKQLRDHGQPTRRDERTERLPSAVSTDRVAVLFDTFAVACARALLGDYRRCDVGHMVAIRRRGRKRFDGVG